MIFSEIRVRTRIPQGQLKEQVGKLIGPGDSDLQLVGPARVMSPAGRPLAIYLPGVLRAEAEEHREVLSGIKVKTDMRHRASGSRPRTYGRMTRSNHILSATIGFMDNQKEGKWGTNVCRTTGWTGKHVAEFKSMFPLFRMIGQHLREQVPDRWAVQMREVERTPPELIIPDTPFTTITVNNTYPTGVHKDKGDLEKGFSSLFVLRRGEFTGGMLTFPEWRFRVDMQDGDLLLMDAHEWHGNTPMQLGENAERISLVLYFRTNMTQCPPPGEPMLD